MNPIAILMTCVWLAVPAFAAAPAGSTLKNLPTAWQGESNASARYTRFAEAADVEGHRQAAKLFRAAAKAEPIHAGKHGKAIRQLGGSTPELVLEPVTVGTTEENLRAAVAGETAESTTMYPDFEKAAEREKARKALTSFRYARKTEAAHIELFTAALESLASAAESQRLQLCPSTLTLLDQASPACKSVPVNRVSPSRTPAPNPAGTERSS